MNSVTGKEWHAMESSDAIDHLESHEKSGLSEREATRRLDRYGTNELTRKKGQGVLVRFLLQFKQPLVIILLVATLITFLLKEYVDSAVILAVVLVNAIIGFMQESKAIKAIEALANAMTSETTVLREGKKRRINSYDLVPGDMVILQSGDKVPADMRLIHTKELQIDESALTGESIPVSKENVVLESSMVIGDRRNMAYSSSLVTYGTGQGVVTGTGDRTEIGRINALISSADVLETPLTRKIHHFSSLLLYVILGLAAATFAIGFFRGQNPVEMFMASVALAVGAIPEGMPAAITITLAIGVSRMAKRHAIIRKLPAVETLGSTTVVCSDKTGTLTQNQMTVQEIRAGGLLYGVSGSGYAPDGEISTLEGGKPQVPNISLLEILKAGVLCNDARIKETTNVWTVEGDPTEGALLVSGAKGGFQQETLNDQMPRLDVIPFESQHQYMATLHHQGEGKPRVMYVKGSVESLCVECSIIMGPEGSPDVAPPGAVTQWVESMTNKGLRVLAFARKGMNTDTEKITHADVSEGLEFLGLQGMIDPPRPEALEAVTACQKAGIRVKMITGDHAGTAAAIARQMGLCGDTCSLHNREVITGRQIGELQESLLSETAETTAVFARVSPEQKLRLVEALQKRDHVVAMTGDGVNDAPALRQADIGIAMGIAGTEVSKESADMILTDDNFATIRAAVEEGRGVFDNLIKFISWTLPTNGGEGLVILIAIFLGTLLPILPLQILWINMTTALLLGLMLAFEPKEEGLMDRPPREPATPILTKTLIIRIAIVSVLLVIGAFGLFQLEMAILKGNEAMARTLAVNVFIFGEMAYLFNCRSLTRPFWQLGVWTNPLLLAGVVMMTLMQILYTYWPFLNRIFQGAPLGLLEWALVAANSLLIFIVIEIEKWLRRRNASDPGS